MEVESELKSLITVGLFTYVSLTYCYRIAAKIPKGLPRLLALLPVMIILFIIPINLHSIYLGHPLVILRVEHEPHFKSPHLASSLQDFWGRRWNLRVLETLRLVIYYPIRSVSIRIIGDRSSSLPPVFVTFAVSGLIHELLYYSILRAKPTWEITWFFVLHGVLVDMEIILKKKVKLRLHRAITGPLAMANLTLTSVCLVLAPLLRNRVDERIIHEFYLFLDFFLSLFPSKVYPRSLKFQKVIK
ncbi:probable long-chain-alcohol O-fatty-acyltransferase 1 [Hibiscus syriacus]|uniref:probable long-chain-alcohol O-fatty-acyltransferase 1 n=1 Tax=Hibiscus syriacus TaxID=106335 RepID=UPI001923D5ED|nr:probable long-chain-alcohol O-fatty-acyltransferase 1 [Hibiscus syriacus]